MREKQRRDRVAGTVRERVNGQEWRGDPPIRLGRNQQHLNHTWRRFAMNQAGDQNDFWPQCEQAACRLDRIRDGGHLGAGEGLQLEDVGGDHVGSGNGLGAQKLRDPVADVEAGIEVAHYRIAEVEGLGVGLAHAGDGIEDDLSQGGIAKIAGEDGIAGLERAPRFDAIDQIAHVGGIEDLAGPMTVAGVV